MSGPQLVIFVLIPVAGYLLGSVPFAWMIGRGHGVDLRQVGSKNIGATNLARVLGTRYFFYAFFLDAAKGFVPVLTAALLVRYWNSLQYYVAPPWYPLPSWSPLLTALTCVLGHLFPIWLGFRGGKGVATGFGVVAGFWPLYTIAGLLALGVFVTTLMIYRYISVSSMSGVVSFTLFVLLLGRWDNPHNPAYVASWSDLGPLVGAAGLLSCIIVFRHRGNIRRLLEGTEVTVGYRERRKHDEASNEPPASDS